MYKNVITILLFLFSLSLLAQKVENKKDSIKSHQLKEVIIVATGQQNPQSVKKAIYDVTVVQNKKIHHLAATNIEDVLRQSLNLNIIPNLSTGKSEVSLFGLDGQYVKILVDNIPLANDRGYGNNADLSQINLQDVEQIEIVEGAMAVEYGANAVTGVINIVTNKKSSKKLKASVNILEETVGNEYKLFDKGKHVQSVNITGNITEKIFSTLSYSRNHFAGFFDHRKGRDYYGKKDERGHRWYPRMQHNASFLISFKPNKWNTFYKFSYLNDKLDNYNKIFSQNLNPATNVSKPFANDKRYFTERLYHHLNLRNELSRNSNVEISILHQKQERKVENYIFYIKSRKEKDGVKKTVSEMNVLSSTGAFNFTSNSKKIKAKVGYDLGLKNIVLSGLRIVDSKSNTKEKSLNHYDIFGFTEYQFNSNFSARAGVRGMFSELFKTKIAYSLSAKHTKNDWTTRFVFGSAPRNPNFTELYYSFVDVNHNVIGNESLKAENAISLNVNLKKFFDINEDYGYRFKISGQFLDIEDKITWVTISKPKKREVYSPINIDQFKSWSVALNNSFYHKNNLELSLGAVYLGVSENLKSKNRNDDYLYNLQLNSNLIYKLPQYGLVFSSYYKYTGSKYRFITDQNGKLVKGKQFPYHWLDVSVSKYLLNKKLQAVFGVRNLTNTTKIKSGITQASTHSDRENFSEFAYGRSYFAKLIYNIF